MKGEFLFLGTGGSSGTPLIGCTCMVCTSTDSHDQRLRPSGLVMLGEKKLLIDAGPDLRQQALRYHINTLDGVLLTHAHFDHVSGLDELRVYYLKQGTRLPILVSAATLQDLKRRYDYLFAEKSPTGTLAAQLDFQVLEGERGIAEFLGFPIQYMQYEQSNMPVMGYRFGSFAYVSDIRNYPETLFTDLSGVEILVLSALRVSPSFVHFNLEEAVAFSQKVGAKQTYFTHISHNMGYKEANARVPKGMQLAYDGLKLEFDYDF